MTSRATGNGESFGLERLERETLQERAYAEVKKAMMGGDIAAGEPITIRALARALGTSVMPVREALRRLVAERALELLPNRSVILPVMTPERFEEISRIRIALEGMMAESAAKYIKEDELRRMAKVNEDLVAKLRQKNKRYLALNQEFHFQLYHAARMPQAMSIVETLWLQIGPFLRDANSEADLDDPDFLDHHEAMLQALAKRDGKRARAAIEADISEAAAVIAGVLRERASEAAR
ncbi:MAG TPA: GntR family transcriptional regulator [Candidatus Cybelea sp.]|nr:GntR family transcriptional regulator [Candidatus Cybelea sp.]